MSKTWGQMTPQERNGRGTAAWKRTRQAVLIAHNYICHMCGHPGADTVDHLVPLAHGGTNTYDNLRPAHGKRQAWGCPGNYAKKDGPTPALRPPSRHW